MSTQRLAWPDVAKGLSIIGVVVLHVSLLIPGARDTALSQANTVIDPLRMPLFFLVSGLFSSKVLNFSLPELFRRRLWFFLIPYLVWVPIEVTLTNEMRQLAGISEPFTLREYVELIVTGRNMAWFLYALVLFNLVLWLTRKLPMWVTFVVALSPVLGIQWHHEVPIVAKVIMYLPIFMAGTYACHVIKRFATTALTPTRILFALAGYLSAVALVIAWNNFIEANHSFVLPVPVIGGLDHAALQLLVNQHQYFLMLPAGVVLVVALTQVPGLSDTLQFLGRNTLPIYLGHPIALTMLVSFPRELYDLPVGMEGAGFWMSTHVWIVIGLVASAAGGLGMWALGKVPGLRWSLYPPKLPEPKRTSSECRIIEPYTVGDAGRTHQ
ncbi:acyltransferase family protein [Corynebacterium cystitidis]|uniref:acyltransferase family protein n=1 Tax=Corynebacterium cystitidis TaxID=35757 RepID=UPI00211EC151|nr:acyltransferase family protein [Corynebacterium cystitidis]